MTCRFLSTRKENESTIRNKLNKSFKTVQKKVSLNRRENPWKMSMYKTVSIVVRCPRKLKLFRSPVQISCLGCDYCI